MGFIDLGVNRIITIHSSYLIVFLKLVFQMKCMLHEINHGVVFPFCPVAPEKPPSLAVATPACSGSVVCSFWTFQGSGLLQRGLPRERKSPPGGGEDGFWAGCPHMDKTHSPDSVDRGQGPGKQLRVPLGPQLPHHVHPASNWQLHSLLPSQGKAPLLNAHRCEVLVTPATITHTQCHCQIPSSYGYMGYGQSYTETQFPCEGHGGNDSPNHSVRLGGVSESVPGGGIQGDIMTPPCLCLCRPPGKRLPAPRKPETASLTQPCRTVSHPPWPTVFTDGPVSKV